MYFDQNDFFLKLISVICTMDLYLSNFEVDFSIKCIFYKKKKSNYLCIHGSGVRKFSFNFWKKKTKCISMKKKNTLFSTYLFLLWLLFITLLLSAWLTYLMTNFYVILILYNLNWYKTNLWDTFYSFLSLKYSVFNLD